MSLYRFVYYSAVIGGWAAFLAWMLAELLVFGGATRGTLKVAIVGAIVGAAIGAGLSLVSGMTAAQWKRLLVRLPPGLIGGAIGGAAGGSLGDLMFSAVGLPRALGWMVMGLIIGSTEGLYERSPSKLRNGLIGGTIGGFLGGILFDPISNFMASGSGMAARAVAFTILGISIGALIGLTHVVLKEAWLTVVDGFRPGRQLILTQRVTVLGRGDHLPMPFLGYSGRDLESEHLRITRQPDGRFSIEDNRSRLGTLVNGQRVQGPLTLGDGDLIRLGSNIVRFNLRQGRSGRIAVSAPVRVSGGSGSVPPPPPPAGPAPAAAPPPSSPRIPPPPPPPGSNR